MNQEQPFFTVVIPSLNQGTYLEQALLSVLRQDCRDVEIIVIDGGSTDDSVSIIRKYEVSISWWCSEPDGGQSVALNKGFSKARGRFLLWLNVDDLLLPGTLNRAQAYLSEHPNCRWLAGNLIYMDSVGKVLWCARDGKWRDFLYRQAPVRVYGPTSFFDRELFEQVGGFDESLRYTMDTDLWLRFRAGGVRFERLPHYCWAFRIHDGSKTSGDLTGRTDPRMAAEQVRMYAKNGLIVTRRGLRMQQVNRLLNGAYLRAWLDTVWMRGKVL